MKNNIQQLKTYTCASCKQIGGIIGIVQTEMHYYSFNLSTKQWEDFHGDESVESQHLFCVNCNKKISKRILG